MRRASSIIYYLCIGGLALVALLFCGYVLAAALLEVENFRPMFVLSSTPWPFSNALASVFIRSVTISAVASTVAYIAVESIVGEDIHWGEGLILCLFYSFDPVVRALSLRGLLVISTTHLASGGVGQALYRWIEPTVLPGIALAFTYAPFYGAVRALDAVNIDRSTHRYLGFLYERLQPSLRRAPLSLSIMMLFCLFDPWVAPLVQGKLSDYWGHAVLSQAVDWRDVHGAVVFCLTGLLFVVSFLGGLIALRGCWNLVFRRLKPSPRLMARGSLRLRLGLFASLLAWGLWTPVWLFLQTAANAPFGEGAGMVAALLATDVVNVLSMSISLAFSAAGLSVSFGALLLLATLRYGRFRSLVVVCSTILVLSPELAFALLFNAATSLSLAKPGFGSALVAILAYMVPLAFLILENYVAVRAAHYSPLLGSAAAISLLRAAKILITLFARQLLLVALLVAWLVLEDVILLQYALGSVVGTVAVTVYNSSSKGMRLGVALTAVSGALVKGGLIMLAIRARVEDK